MKRKAILATSFCFFLTLLIYAGLAWADKEGEANWYLDAEAQSRFSYAAIRGGTMDGKEEQDFTQHLNIYGSRTSGERSYAISFFGSYEKEMIEQDEGSLFRDVTDTMDNAQSFEF